MPSLSIHYENRRQVFVEDDNDAKYYEKLYQIYRGNLNPGISLNFISTGAVRKDKNNMPNNSCADVISAVGLLRGFGNKTIWGIIDRDVENNGSEFVRVLGEGRHYSIENYVLDPLLVGAILLRDKKLELLAAGGGKMAYAALSSAGWCHTDMFVVIESRGEFMVLNKISKGK